MKNLHDMKMKDLLPEERPVEKYLSRGATALSNGELLAISPDGDRRRECP